MRARFISVYKKLASLPGGRQIHAKLAWIYAELDQRLRNQPGLPGKLWRLFHDEKWQESTATGTVLSLSCTIAVIVVVPYTGYRWEISIAIGLAVDAVMYAFYRLGLWPEHKIHLVTSSFWYWSWIAVFFFINGTLTWLLMEKADLRTSMARAVLMAIGAALNPVVFLYRRRFAFVGRVSRSKT